MQDIVIKTVQPNEVLRVDTLEKSDVCDVFQGTILYKGQDIPVYIKAYAFNNLTVVKGDKGLLNEVIGYLLCNLYQVPQPEKAFIVLMPKEKLSHLWHGVSERLKNSYASSQVIPMFATQRIPATSIPLQYDHSVQCLLGRLKKWHAYKIGLVCDEVMANTDRLPRNILTANAKDFWLIDNGKLAIEQGMNWKRTSLIEGQNYSNYLADLSLDDIQADSRKGSSLIITAAKHNNDFKDILSEAKFWIDSFSNNEDKLLWDDFLEFLSVRNANIMHLLRQRYGMLSL